MMNTQKHLTLSNRTYIEQSLMQGFSFKQIGTTLHKDPTTISKEVRKHRKLIRGKIAYGNCIYCKNRDTCIIRGGEKETSNCSESHYCHKLCRKCREKFPTEFCSEYAPYECPDPHKFPYVCNFCSYESNCKKDHYIYKATYAQKQYETTLTKSREGINLMPEELDSLNKLISPLVLKGQPLSHIFAVHADEIPVCRRTLYNYFDQCVFQARNIDLPRRVRYKKRKNATVSRKRTSPQIYRNNRTYTDFEKFMELHPEMDVVEMDTVKGIRTAGKCLLTLLFRSCSFMIIILLPDCTQESVIKAINGLTETIGINLFRKYFPVILTDNGSEFKNPYDIEKTCDGKHRTYVFYCDPYVSNQKARLEKNHEYIRYVIPKGRSLYKYTQNDINLMASHINSTARDSLNGHTPFELAELLIDKKIPLLTGQYKVSPDEVMLKPALIKHSGD